MTWIEEARKLREEGLSYKEVGEKLGWVKTGTVKSRLYRDAHKNDVVTPTKETKKRKKLEVNEDKPVPTTSDSDLKDKVLKELRKPKAIGDLVRGRKVTSDVTEERVAKLIDSLRKSGYVIDNFGDKMMLRTIQTMEHNRVDIDWRGEKVIKFGVASDQHMNSKYQQLTHLNTFYDICQKEGITTVYNPGDLVEGEYQQRKGHVYEIFNHGADDQVDYVIRNYPRRKGMITKFITGNHDHTHLKNSGYDIGKRIDLERDDMEYLGMNNASIFLTPNCRMDLAHPLDGSSYALSYSIQKSIEAMSVDDLPQIFVVGHHHKAIYLYTRGIHALEAGTFQAQSAWMKGKRLAAHVGGWIIEVHVNDRGEISRFIPEWVCFPKSIKEDY